MFNLFRNVLLKGQNSEENAIFTELYEIERRISAVRSLFSSVVNEDLIEAYVFELGSLEAKRSFLLKRAKELEMKRYPFPVKNCDETV